MDASSIVVLAKQFLMYALCLSISGMLQLDPSHKAYIQYWAEERVCAVRSCEVSFD